MKRISNPWIVHGFALLHAATTLLCYALGVGDTLLLTLWTVIMTAFLCVRKRQSLEVTVIVVLLINFVGYLIGVAIAYPIGHWIAPPALAHALSTFLTTEGLGWAVLAFFHFFPAATGEDAMPLSYGQLKWITIAAASILVFRLLLSLLGRTALFGEVSLTDLSYSFLSRPGVLLLMIGGTMLYTLHQPSKGIFHLLAIVGISILAALLTGIMALPQEPLTRVRLAELLTVAVLCEALIFSVVYLTVYALTVRRSMEAERNRANLARHEYLQLKQQVNPHFLFNSLNILDCLVADGKNSDARHYIHKLSALYRYMLRSENDPLVSLSEEMEYVRIYTDLLKVRFPEGLEIETDLREEDLSRYIVKYAVQLLVENAQKHNAISPARPLRIRIVSDGNCVTVTNNLIPKLTPSESTGLGLKYIRQNFLDRSGKQIRILQTEDRYQVELPLL